MKYKKFRIFFEDEAGFGRISKPKYCWCEKGIRPIIPCQRVRQYFYAYGAVDPNNGDSFFERYDKCITDNTNDYLRKLSEKYPNEMLFLIGDNASWHKSKELKIPENIRLLFIPPYTPEMNPIEQIWREIRAAGFANEYFDSLEDVKKRFDNTTAKLSHETVISITKREWILSI